MPKAAHFVAAADTEVLVADQGTTRTITPRGDLDLSSSPPVSRALAQALTDGVATVVLDLSQTTFLDSSGVHLVLGAHARAKASQTHLVIVPGPPQVHRTFELCGVADQLPFVQQPG